MNHGHWCTCTGCIVQSMRNRRPVLCDGCHQQRCICNDACGRCHRPRAEHFGSDGCQFLGAGDPALHTDGESP